MTEAIIKGKSAVLATEEELELINRYTRRRLQADEVYIFSLVLCDNEIDRDYECFSTEALLKLKELFLGKTGIFDHDPKGKNQSARVFDTAVQFDDSKRTKTGERYCFLKAKAYMVRSEKNKDLMLEIDAGIKKEVSVGCSIAHSICSVCGRDRNEGCEHQPGKRYRGQLCYRILSAPIDAYEFSFVAVPSQRGAGVVKQYQKRDETADKALFKMLEQGEKVQFSDEETARMKRYLQDLEQWAEDGKRYREELCKEILHLSVAVDLPLSGKVLKRTMEEMGTKELRELRDRLDKTDGVFFRQLSSEAVMRKENEDAVFKI